MTISEESWVRYIDELRAINDTAADQMVAYLKKHPIESYEDLNAAIEYAHALVTKYGEGAAELACEMYDIMVELSGVVLPAAEPAATATIAEVAKTINGIRKYSSDIEMLASGVSRLVKMAGVDTTMQNAIRDGAEWAWIPHGDTCSFCIMLASNGWQHASKKAIKNGHAEHIHANCDCTYAIRFNEDTEVEGYDKDRYLRMYDNADGNKWQDKLNAMRRDKYEAMSQEEKDALNAKKREEYRERKEREELLRNT